MNLHFGPPNHVGGLRFHHGTLRAKGYEDQEVYFEHPIKWWFGISFARLFIGIIRTDRTRDVREARRPSETVINAPPGSA